MRANPFILMIVFFLSVNPLLFSQSTKEKLDHVYGLSQNLYNGKIYEDFYNYEVIGHPFIKNKTYLNGSLSLRIASYNHVQLNYDIYTQKVLLAFKTQNNAYRQIEIPLEHLLAFKIENQDFRNIKTENQSYKIFQVIGDGEHQIYIQWYKKLEVIRASSNYKYEFTNAKRTLFLHKDEHLIAIDRNKKLRKIFSKKQQIELKKWMKSKHIKLRKANDNELLILCQYLNLL